MPQPIAAQTTAETGSVAQKDQSKWLIRIAVA